MDGSQELQTTFLAQHQTIHALKNFVGDRELNRLYGPTTTTVMAYKMENENSAIDSDGHSLEVQFLPQGKVGSGAYEIWQNDSLITEREVVPAGVNVCSYSAEIRAIDAALDKVSEEIEKVIRIFTDSYAVVEGLQGILRSQCTGLQRLASKLHALGKRCKVYVTLVPSHSGTAQNERADRLAKFGLKLPLEQQLAVPVDFADVKAQLKKTSKTKSAMRIQAEYEAREARTAEVTLAQFEAKHVPSLHPVGSYLNKKVVRCECGTAAKKDADHVLFRCPLTNGSRRNELSAARERENKSRLEMIRKWPSKFLAFFKREK